MAEALSSAEIRFVCAAGFTKAIGSVSLDFLWRKPCPLPRLAAENLFLRKQLACYVERKVRPKGADNASRPAPVLLSRFVAWRFELADVIGPYPDTLVRWNRNTVFFSGKRSHVLVVRPRIPVETPRQLIAEITTVSNRTMGGEGGASPHIGPRRKVYLDAGFTNLAESTVGLSSTFSTYIVTLSAGLTPTTRTMYGTFTPPTSR